MTQTSRKFRLAALAALLAVGMTAGLTAGAASTANPDTSAAKRYEQERAVCLSGQSNQPRDTCLREAGAALADARKAQAGSSAADLERNAALRCEKLPDTDRKDCLARMKGEGSTSGSVAGGGIYRELVTREVGTPAVAQPAKP